jgi:hypothetical protein
MCEDCAKKKVHADNQESRERLLVEFEAFIKYLKSKRLDLFVSWEALSKNEGKNDVATQLKLLKSSSNDDYLKALTDRPRILETSIVDPIPPGDRVICMASGINKFGPSDSCYWILTDKHIVIVRYGLIRTNELRGTEVIALDQITGFEKSKTSRNDVVWNLVITRASNTDGIHGVNDGVANAMVTAYNAAKTNLGAGSGTRQEKDAAESIRNLKGLLDEGLITQEEFDLKRAKLLEEM